MAVAMQGKVKLFMFLIPSTFPGTFPFGSLERRISFENHIFFVVHTHTSRLDMIVRHVCMCPIKTF